jgi:hypothetical protein
MRLEKSLKAWGTPYFIEILKQEIAATGTLPLQQGLATGSHALDDNISVMINGISEEENCICIRAGVFYTSILAGCSCADDPTPIDEHSEYCEIGLAIDRITADTTVTLLGEPLP